MTEREYVNATNLAKIRSALAVLRDYIPPGAKHDRHIEKALRHLVIASVAIGDLVKVSKHE